MAFLTEDSYRFEIRTLRSELTYKNANERLPTTKGSGRQWYNLRAVPNTSLYFSLFDLYIKAFRNANEAFKFFKISTSIPEDGPSIHARQLAFLDSYNGKGNREGLGYRDIVSISDLNNALSTAAKSDFHTKRIGEQQNAMLCITIAFAEGIRFKDVEDSVVEGTKLPDFRWKNHANQSKIMIKPPVMQ